MSFLAPYVNSMRLGQGFNSYTQEICIEDAVLIHPAPSPASRVSTVPAAIAKNGSLSNASPSPPKNEATAIEIRPISANGETDDHYPEMAATPATTTVKPEAASASSVLAPTKATTTSRARANSNHRVAMFTTTDTINRDSTTEYPTEVSGPSAVPGKQETPPNRNLNQIVTYSSRAVDNISDVIEAFSISSSASIKYGTISGSGSTSFVHESKVNQSDINYIISVKVTNETSPIPDVMEFNPIEGLDHSKFTEVYGDCFISGFLEGGEFSAIISIKVNSKSKVAGVKAAAEAQLAIAAVPGLSVAAKGAIDRSKSNVWDDTETTISVNWSGGGEIKDPDQKWDLPTVVDVASRFPHMVEECAQRTSAILTRYTGLRTFQEEDAKNDKDHKFNILDYDLCTLYTQDLFSAFTVYKGIWAELTEMIKHPDRYQEREKTSDVPDPVRLTSKGLNDARTLARWGMTAIVDETKRLINEPQYANFDEHGEQRPIPYEYPGELSMRLPVKVRGGLSMRDLTDPEQGEPGRTPLTAEEIAAVGKWARKDELHLSPLVGDPPLPRSSWLDRGKTTLFCTLDLFPNPKKLGNLAKIRLHAHHHHHFDIFADFQHHSKHSEGSLSAIAFSTTADQGTKSGPDGTHRQVARPSTNESFWSPLADSSATKVVKITIEYFPCSGRIAALVLWDANKNEVTGWRQYGQTKVAVPAGLEVEEQSAPDESGGWALVGFWGHADAVVVTRLGAIWKRV